MKNQITTVLILLFLSPYSFSFESVTECTFSSMKNKTIEGIKILMVNMMKDKWPSPIDISIEDVAMVDRGVLAFEDWSYVGTRPEHAFAVSFKTKAGTPIDVISARDNVLCDSPRALRYYNTLMGTTHCYYRPINNVISVPDPKIIITYDSEGNEKARYCRVDLYYTHNRQVLFVNSNNERVIEEGLNKAVAIAEILK